MVELIVLFFSRLALAERRATQRCWAAMSPFAPLGTPEEVTSGVGPLECDRVK